MRDLLRPSDPPSRYVTTAAAPYRSRGRSVPSDMLSPGG